MIKTHLDHGQLLEDFYSRPFDFSYSGLNKLLFSPALFYTHYVLRQREDSSDQHVINGKVVHALVLEDGSFDDNFIVSPAKLPGGEGKTLVDNVFQIYLQAEGEKSEMRDFSKEILVTMKNMNYYQSLSSDEARLEKVLTPANLNYFEFLKQKESKTLIDADTLEYCRRACDSLKRHSKAADLLKIGHNSTSMLKVFNEKMLRTELEGFPFGLRGILDNFVVDYERRQIFINDLKVTTKSLSDFTASLEYFMYWAQAAIYVKLVEQWVSEDENIQSPEGWEVFFHFIVIDKYLQIYPFPVRAETLDSWQARLEEKLEVARYHYESRDFSLPYEFVKGQVEL